MQALPLSAFFVFLEAAVGGAIALFLVYPRGEVQRGFALFTGFCLLVCAAAAIWLRAGFPPSAALALSGEARLWFGIERALTITFVVLLAAYLVCLQVRRQTIAGLVGPAVPLTGLAALWSSALVDPGAQLGGLGAPLAVLAGAVALGAAITGLSLGHWYLVMPSLSTVPLIRLVFLCFGALAAQVLLLPLLLLLPGAGNAPVLFGEYVLFLVVRLVFGLAVPIAVAFMAWRTARIRSLDSATGLLYILVALILTGEIVARSLFFLSGVAT